MSRNCVEKDLLNELERRGKTAGLVTMCTKRRNGTVTIV
jgi:acetyl-CoA acetyltransferase